MSQENHNVPAITDAVKPLAEAGIDTAERPHHCSDSDFAAMLDWLDRIANQDDPIPSVADTDWLTKAAVLARMIRFILNDHTAARPAAEDGETK